MKYTLVLIYLVFFAFFAKTQSYSIEWSEMISQQGRLVYLLPNKENNFYALRWVGGRILGTYQVSQHEELKITKKGKIKLVADKSIANFEGAKVIGDKLVVFLSDKQVGYNHFYMQKYDDELKPIGETVKLASYAMTKKRSKGWFNIEQSSNKQFFGVVWQVKGKKGERDLYGFKVFNNQLEIVNEGEYPLPFDPKSSTINAQHISNNGDYFMAVTEYEDKKATHFFKNYHTYKALHIIHINDDGLEDYKLDLGEKRVEAMSMHSDDKNIFTITGLYGKPDEAGVKGVFIKE